MRILVVDDEKLLVKGIKFNLENEGYTVDTAYDGNEALSKIKAGNYDIIVLDLMLPEISGLNVCSRVREFSNVPIIMLTAKAEDADKIMGFESGADDYLTKPFNVAELKSRIRAILRRSGQNTAMRVDNKYEAGGITLDYNGRVAIIGEKRVELTIKEFDMLDLLMKNPGRVFSRENMLDIVWGYEYPGDVRTVDVHIRRLREKIEEDSAQPKFVMTKWGVGYYFSDK